MIYHPNIISFKMKMYILVFYHLYREQRLTGICIHILIALSVNLTGVLRHVPMAVLYGVFLYMGVTSLAGVQFVDRILILLMPSKKILLFLAR